MSRPFLLARFVPLVLLLLASAAAEAPISHRSPGRYAVAVAVGAQLAEAPSSGTVGCSRSAEAASRVVEESCTDDIVRSFFGVRGRGVCCRALEAVGARCYRAVFSDSPFADVYPTILGNVCGLAAAPAPSHGASENDVTPHTSHGH